MVRLRTARGGERCPWLTKSCGHRMPASSTKCFAKRSLEAMPQGWHKH
jgi:transposase